MTKVLVNEYSGHPPKERGIPGSQEKIQRGTVPFPIQYYLNNTADPRYDLPVMWHTEFELIHVMSGTYNIFLRDHEAALEKDDVCFIPGRVLHGDAERRGAALYESVVFDMDMLRLRSYYPDDFISAVVGGSVLVADVIPHTNERVLSVVRDLFGAMKVRGEGFEFSVTAGLFLLFGEIKRQRLYVQKKSLSAGRLRQEEQMEAVIGFIKKEYSGNITLEDMAARANLSPKYFCRLFKDTTGRSPIEYLNWFRVNMACTRLRGSQDKMADIAYECGFNDFSYFIKIFRRYKGITPLKYRNSATERAESARP